MAPDLSTSVADPAESSGVNAVRYVTACRQEDAASVLGGPRSASMTSFSEVIRAKCSPQSTGHKVPIVNGSFRRVQECRRSQPNR